MEQTLVTWKMSSASPGAVPVRANDRQQLFEYRLDAGRGRARLEPTCSAFTGDGRSENVQSAADENEEWAKIENIMASLDAGLNDRDDGLNGFAVQSHGRKLVNSAAVTAPSSRVGAEVHSVRQWLDSIGLSHLEDILLTNGFDDIDFLGPSVLSDGDLVEIGVNNAVSRHRLLSAACKLPPFSSHAPAHFEGLVAWLTALRLSEYIETFQLHGFTSTERLHNLWDVELTSVCKLATSVDFNTVLG